MALKKFRPVTPASRFRSVSSFDEVTRSEPEKSLTEGLSGVPKFISKTPTLAFIFL